MDTNFQIQSLKTQIMNFNSQIDNIISQNNNFIIMNDNKMGDQLLNLSVQMINTGIQAFNIAKNIVINNFNYFEQLKSISQQINSLINENDINIQQQTMQQQQMMIQQQMMMQQQQMMMMQQNQNNIRQSEIYNIVFQKLGGANITTIQIQEGSTVEELLNKFKDRVKDSFSDEQIKSMKFFPQNAHIRQFYWHDKEKINDMFRSTTIYVEYK